MQGKSVCDILCYQVSLFPEEEYHRLNHLIFLHTEGDFLHNNLC